MQFRIGINVGDSILQGERLYGDGVNIAARLERLSDTGGTCMSGTVYDQILKPLLISECRQCRPGDLLAPLLCEMPGF